MKSVQTSTSDQNLMLGSSLLLARTANLNDFRAMFKPKLSHI